MGYRRNKDMFTARRDGKSYYTNRQRKKLRKYMILGGIILAVLTMLLVVVKIVKPLFFESDKYVELSDSEITASKPDLDVQLLDVNEYSRPGNETDKITGIVIHYTANPGATAKQNRDYFNGLKDSHETKASSHFIIGLDGEVIQCVPIWEIAYASNDRNHDTVSIECCHPDESGRFNKETYQSMVQLTAWLCQKFKLDENDVIRHYDVTGKNCPKYFVEDEEAWNEFKDNVKRALEKAS